MEVLNTPKATEIKQIAIKSVKWTSLSEIIFCAIQPIVTVILARLLVPADFGVVGVAMIAIGLAQIFQNFGLGETLIQRETEIEKSANIVFWSNIVLSALLYLILFVSAPLLSRFFHDERVINVLRVLCLQIVLFSLTIVHQALFQRNFQFKELFFIRISSVIVSGLVAIPMALSGYGVWSLVYGTLAGTITQVLLYWKTSPWKPELSYDFQLAKQLYGFSSWVVLETFLMWLLGWGDSIVLGHFLGVKEFGIYRVGTTFLMFIFGIFFNPLIPISYSSFSKLQSDKNELKKNFLKIVRLIVTISLPIGGGLVILSPAISSLVLGQKWQGIEIVIATIGLMYGIGWTVGLNHELYRAVGRPDINTKLAVIINCYYLPAYILAAPYGLFVFCIARFILGMSSFLFYLYFTKKVLNLPFKYLWEATKFPLMASLIMVAFIYLTIKLIGEFVDWGGWFNISGTIIIGATIYVLTLWLLKKEIVLQFLKLARECIK